MSFDPFVGASRERSRSFGDYLVAFRRQRALPLKLISAAAFLTAYGLDSGWEAALLLVGGVPVLAVLWYPVWRYFRLGQR